MEEFVEQCIGQTIGARGVLKSVLGVGDVAAVYAAVDEAGNEAAVKILHAEIVQPPGWLRRSPKDDGRVLARAEEKKAERRREREKR